MVKPANPTEVEIHQVVDPQPAIKLETGSNQADSSTRDLLVLILALLIIGMIFYNNGSWFNSNSTTVNIISPANQSTPPNFITNPQPPLVPANNP